jgi:hypothetical protein
VFLFPGQEGAAPDEIEVGLEAREVLVGSFSVFLFLRAFVGFFVGVVGGARGLEGLARVLARLGELHLALIEEDRDRLDVAAEFFGDGGGHHAGGAEPDDLSLLRR